MSEYKHLTDDERQTPDLLLLRAALDASRAELERVRGPDWKSWKDRSYTIDAARQVEVDDLRAQLAAADAMIGEVSAAHMEWLDMPDRFPTERLIQAMSACTEDLPARALATPAAEATPLTPSPPPCQVCGRPWVRYPDGSCERCGELRALILQLGNCPDCGALWNYGEDRCDDDCLATPPQAAGEDDTCECGASDWLVTATMIECNQCKRLWGRCNGIWVPDMTTWPAVEAMEGQHYPGGEYVTTGGGCPTCKGTHMVSGTHGLDACPVCRPAEPTAGGEECSRCNAPLEQFPNSDTWYCSAGCSGMKELAPAKPGEGGA